MGIFQLSIVYGFCNGTQDTPLPDFLQSKTLFTIENEPWTSLANDKHSKTWHAGINYATDSEMYILEIDYRFREKYVSTKW